MAAAGGAIAPVRSMHFGPQHERNLDGMAAAHDNSMYYWRHCAPAAGLDLRPAPSTQQETGGGK